MIDEDMFRKILYGFVAAIVIVSVIGTLIGVFLGNLIYNYFIGA